jgi:arginine repressor
VGRVIDELDHDGILGCVAGDDTVILVTKDPETAVAVCDYLTELGG